MQITPLHPIYSKYQGKVIDFHGWGLPVQFSGIIQEHTTVRTRVGLFDVSHMGEFWVEGPEATSFLDRMVTNEIAPLKVGSIRYSPLCFPTGGVVDDLLVYRFSETKYFVVVNASNIDADFAWFQDHLPGSGVNIQNVSQETAQVALQGPLALAVMQDLQPAQALAFASLKYYQFLPQLKLRGIDALISRTGYTGEDGFEIYVKPEDAIPLWEILMEVGHPFGIQAIGLGARDTLRFEAALPLHGNELSAEITPIEAGLDRFVKFTKSDFIGKTALLKQFETGAPRKLVGLEMIDRGIPRSDYPVIAGDQKIGYVTSGSYSPTLEKNLALALVDRQCQSTEIFIEVRGKLLAAKQTSLPFYSRLKGAK